MMDQTINFMVSGALAAFLSVTISLAYQSKSQKRKVVMHMIEHHIYDLELRSNVQWIFDNVDAKEKAVLIYPDGSMSEQEVINSNIRYNNLLKLGAWYEILAMLYYAGCIDNYLFDVSKLRDHTSEFGISIKKLATITEIDEIVSNWPNVIRISSN